MEIGKTSGKGAIGFGNKFGTIESRLVESGSRFDIYEFSSHILKIGRNPAPQYCMPNPDPKDRDFLLMCNEFYASFNSIMPQILPEQHVFYINTIDNPTSEGAAYTTVKVQEKIMPHKKLSLVTESDLRANPYLKQEIMQLHDTARVLWEEEEYIPNIYGWKNLVVDLREVDLKAIEHSREIGYHGGHLMLVDTVPLPGKNNLSHVPEPEHYVRRIEECLDRLFLMGMGFGFAESDEQTYTLVPEGKHLGKDELGQTIYSIMQTNILIGTLIESR